MSSSTEVYNAYTELVKVSQDGAYQTFSNLEDYSNYDYISAIYTSNIAGISIRRDTQSNCGLYFTVPINVVSAHGLMKIIYYVSTWINSTINIHLISADSIDEIPTKIVAGEYAWSSSIALANANNKNSVFFEFDDLPLGEHYLFLDVANATGGNEAVLNYIGYLAL